MPLNNINPSNLRAEASLAPQKPISAAVVNLSAFAKTNNAANTAAPAVAESATLKTLGNTVRYEDIRMPDPTREEIDAKIAASEARGAIDIVRLEGKLEAFAATLSGKMDALQTSIQNAAAYNRDTRSLIIASAFALAALIVGMATYGDALFGRGMNVRDVVQAVVHEQQESQKREFQPPTPATAPPSAPTKTPEK
jgi:hypothetical protein